MAAPKTATPRPAPRVAAAPRRLYPESTPLAPGIAVAIVAVGVVVLVLWLASHRLDPNGGLRVLTGGFEDDVTDDDEGSGEYAEGTGTEG
jgi:hypothetical protein